MTVSALVSGAVQSMSRKMRWQAFQLSSLQDRVSSDVKDKCLLVSDVKVRHA